ncbi:MAG: hypothetical protein H0T75_03075 [Rhizobiales bacterium]|nr:hypothetical protein [Hyphomicrobiales bacterium]
MGKEIAVAMKSSPLLKPKNPSRFHDIQAYSMSGMVACGRQMMANPPAPYMLFGNAELSAEDAAARRLEVFAFRPLRHIIQT